LGQAEFGTKMLPGIANEIGERIKEIVENTDQNQNFAQAMQQVTQEFKSLMQGVINMSQGDGGRLLELQGLLAEMVREQRQSNDINKKMLQVARN
jgi:Sec-independent protein translocase protein TatA